MLVVPAAGATVWAMDGACGRLVRAEAGAEYGGMIERDHAPNAGTGLLGANFSRRSRLEPTDDRAGAGRWIAIDESGYHGDQLYGGDRYMILGSVYVIDKHYFVAAKLVDLLLEERFNAMGIDIVTNGVARQFALELATEGPRAMGRDGFDLLIATAVSFFSKKNRTGDHVTVDDLFTVIRQCHAYARRRKAPQAKKATRVLELLHETRSEAEAFACERPAEATPTGE